MSIEKNSDHAAASCREKSLCWRMWLYGILCLLPSTHFNWSAKRLINAYYYYLIHFICSSFQSKTTTKTSMNFEQIHI